MLGDRANLKYLSTKQALEDLALLHDHIRFFHALTRLCNGFVIGS